MFQDQENYTFSVVFFIRNTIKLLYIRNHYEIKFLITTMDSFISINNQGDWHYQTLVIKIDFAQSLIGVFAAEIQTSLNWKCIPPNCVAYIMENEWTLGH